MWHLQTRKQFFMTLPKIEKDVNDAINQLHFSTRRNLEISRSCHIFDMRNEEVILKCRKNCSVKSDHVLKWVICAWSDATQGVWFWLKMLSRKYCSLHQIFILKTQVVLKKFHSGCQGAVYASLPLISKGWPIFNLYLLWAYIKTPLSIKWLQRDSNPQPLSLYKNTQTFSQIFG